MATLLNPFRNSFRYLQRQAHENPVILWSFGIGITGPILAMTVPPIRKRMGWRPAEFPPTTYPLPQRARRPVEGFDDE